MPVKVKMLDVTATASQVLDYRWVCPHCGRINADRLLVKANGSAEGGRMFYSALNKMAEKEAREKLPLEVKKSIAKLYTTEGLCDAGKADSKLKLNGKCKHCSKTAVWGLPSPDTTEHKINDRKCDENGKEIFHEMRGGKFVLHILVFLLNRAFLLLGIFFPLIYDSLPDQLVYFLESVIPGDAIFLEWLIPTLLFWLMYFATRSIIISMDKSSYEYKSEEELEEEKANEALRIKLARELEKCKIAEVERMPQYNKPMFEDKWQEYKKQQLS